MFVVKERVRLFHGKGIKSLEAGEQVRIVGKADGGRVTLVDASGISGEVDAALLTRDLEEVGQIHPSGTRRRHQHPENLKAPERKQKCWMSPLPARFRKNSGFGTV